jgi:hypothetical protein
LQTSPKTASETSTSSVSDGDDSLNVLRSHDAARSVPRRTPQLIHEASIVDSDNYDFALDYGLENLQADVFDLQLANDIGYSIYPEVPMLAGAFALDPMLMDDYYLHSVDACKLVAHDVAASREIETAPSTAMQNRIVGTKSSQRSSPAPLQRQPGFFRLSDVGDEQKLDFFLAESVRQTNAHTYSSFWSSIVMQGVRQVKAIEHAVLAIAEVHWEYHMAGGPGQVSIDCIQITQSSTDQLRLDLATWPL